MVSGLVGLRSSEFHDGAQTRSHVIHDVFDIGSTYAIMFHDDLDEGIGEQVFEAGLRLGYLLARCRRLRGSHARLPGVQGTKGLDENA